jgi:hypothetical protein
MMTYSTAIDAAISLVEAEGSTVRDILTGWTKIREVVYINEPMTDALRSRLAADPRLRYWVTKSTPHNKREEGFTDDTEKVSISFPK